MQLLQQAGLSLAGYAIHSFTFVPDPTGHVTVLHKTDGSHTHCAWHNVPRKLDRGTERRSSCDRGRQRRPRRDLTVNSGAVSWGAGVPEQLHRLLEDAGRRGRDPWK